jgi:heptose-I-phosphate ethanolaminephosphotransferase
MSVTVQNTTVKHFKSDSSKNSCKKLFYIALALGFASFASGIYSFCVTPKWFIVKEMLRSLCIDAIIVGIVLLLPKRLAVLCMKVLFFPVLIFALADLIHIRLIGSHISRFMLQSILETSKNEAYEVFIDFFTPSTSILALMAIFICVFLFYKAIRSIRQHKNGIALYVVSIMLVTIPSFYIFSSKKGIFLLESNSAYVIINTCFTYKAELANIQKLHDVRKMNHFAEVTLSDAENYSQNRTYLFVVGESQDRHHLSLYGYYRDTTPILQARRKNLIVLSDAISAATHTIPSLQSAFLFSEFAGEQSILTAPSLIGLLNDAGFSTWWLSNQTPNSEGLTGTAIIAGDAVQQRFLNYSRSEGRSTSYDEVLLKSLEEVLADTEHKNKAIFLHLIGSHLSYHLRYPDTFNYFHTEEDLPLTSWRTANDLVYINAYDNSIRYTDYIISEILDRVAHVDGSSMMVYFSDHGQEVYDSRPIRGQDAGNQSRFMVDIPFLLWFSPEYKARNADFYAAVLQRTGKPFILDRFPHTAAALCRINFAGYNPERNLFAAEYKDTPRLLSTKQLYDKLAPITDERYGK